MAMFSNNDKCIQDTVDFWTQKTGKKVSEEDAREIISNTSGFFALLREWDERDRNSSTTSKYKEDYCEEDHQYSRHI